MMTDRNTRKRLLCVLHYPPPVHGAGMVGSYIIGSKMINDAFDCHYINLSTSENIDDIGKSDLRKTFALLRLYIRVISILFRKKFGYCYMTINAKGLGFYKEMVIVVLLKLFKIKLIYHYHNKGISTYKKSWMVDRIYRFQFRNSRVILLSKSLYPDVSQYVEEKNVHYCPNGIPDIRGIEFKKLSQKRAESHIPELLYFSALKKDKGVLILLESCKILNSKGIDFRINFAGPQMDLKLKDLQTCVVQNRLDDKVFFYGKQFGRAKSMYFERADLLIHPSLNDAFPLVLLEAMQFGLPVISTFEGAIPEIIEDGFNGFLVQKGNPADLADKITELISNPTLRLLMGERSRKKYSSNYTIDHFENNFLTAVQSIIADFELATGKIAPAS